MQSKKRVYFFLISLLIISIFLAGCSINIQKKSRILDEKYIEKPAVKTKCEGFNYFIIQSHKLTQSSLLLRIHNGPKEIIIKDMTFGNTSLSVWSQIPADTITTITSSDDPTTKSSGDEYYEQLIIEYEIVNGPANNEDRGICTGIVQ